jgi:hypothetical protein
VFGAIGHLLGTLFRAFFKILFAALISAAIGVVAVLVVVSVSTGSFHWPPSTLTLIALIAIGLLSACVGGGFVLMIEAIKALRDVAGTAIKDAEAPIKAAVGELEGRH